MIPDAFRSWNTPWPNYQPIDITPPELHPDGHALNEDWVHDTCPDPTRWWPFNGLDLLTDALRAEGACLYAAHRPLLHAAYQALTER